MLKSKKLLPKLFKKLEGQFLYGNLADCLSLKSDLILATKLI